MFIIGKVFLQRYRLLFLDKRYEKEIIIIIIYIQR